MGAPWWAPSARRCARPTLPASRVRGIGLTGQMHGLVLLDQDLAPQRPAIIWMDRRSANLCPIVMDRVPHDVMLRTAGNRLSPGFAGASLAWLHEVEPRALGTGPRRHPAQGFRRPVPDRRDQQRAERRLGHVAAHDIARREWSPTLADACGVPLDILPPVSESADVVGTLRAEAAFALGLPEGIPVVAGAADQAALLLGVGVVESGRGSITLGTGGQLTVVTNRPWIDPEMRLNTFCHALPGHWYTMGAILNGGTPCAGGETPCRPACPITTCWPGRRTCPPVQKGWSSCRIWKASAPPHMDPQATGAFTGLTTRHTQAHLTRAVLEGVAFAFRDCLQILQAAGASARSFPDRRGGSQGELWRRILADVLGVSLQTIEGAEHTATGAAMLAGLGTHVFYDLPQAVATSVRYGPTLMPDPDAHAIYTDAFAQYQALYPALRAAQ
ncbi:MAG: FGGY family carbohydrate kinase [Anaerolineae bacterium]|nr:FGGY family carbohydrate kinase [Anaerolineae bacterium]